MYTHTCSAGSYKGLSDAIRARGSEACYDTI